MSSDNLRIVPTDDLRFNRVDVQRRLDRGYSNTPSAALDTIAALRAVDALAAALRAVIEHHDRFAAVVIGPDHTARFGDPPAIAEARRVLGELER